MAAARPEKIAISLLKGLKPLGDLSQDKLEELASKSSIQEIPAGRTLFRQGERDKRVIYLLSGSLTLHTAGNPKARTLRARSTPLAEAIAPDTPRRCTAKTKTACKLLFVDSDLLEILTQDENSGLIEVEELSGDDESAWMVRFLQSRAFLKLPTENIQTLLMNLEEVPFAKGDEVIRQGETNDYYYIIHSGRCAVSRRPAPKLDAIQLAILTVGDGFGEEALITGGRRNATVTMLEDGVLMRLEKDKFLALLAEPLINTIDKQTAEAKIAAGCLLIDVRRNDEFMARRVEGSVNIPLSMLRLKLDGLNPEREYVLLCNDGSESAAAAFLLAQHGLDCHVLEGGLNKNALSMPEPNLSVPVLDTPEGRKTLAAQKTQKAAEAKARKISAEADQAREEARKLAERAEAAEAARRDAEEKIKRLQQEEAEKREAALTAARQRLKTESERAKAAEEQAARLKLEAKAAKRKAEEELRRLKAEAEENAKRQAALDSALEHARKVAAEAAREAEAARRQAEKEAAEIRRKAQEEAERLRQEMEETRRRFEEETRQLKERQHREHQAVLEEARRKAEQEHQAALEEARRAAEQEHQAALEAARKQAEEEARRKAEAEAERIRRAAEAEAERLRQEMEAARRELAEQAARLAEQEREQQEKLREQARREAEELARARTAEAESEAERIRRAAEAEAEKLRQEMEAARRELSEQAAELLDREKEHQARLLEQARLQAEELARARTAEAESEAERIRREAMEEAERLRNEIQTTREMLAAQVAEAKRQAERKEQEQIRQLAEAAERKRQELIEAERQRREAALAEQRRAAEEAERRHREELERLAAEEARREEEARRLAEEKAYQEAKARRLAKEKARREAAATQAAAKREAEARRKAKKAEAMRRKAEEIRRQLEAAEQARREEEARQRAEGMSLSEAVLKRVGNRIILEGAQDIFIFKEPSIKPEDLEKEEGPAENFLAQTDMAAEGEEADDGLPSFHFDSPDQDYVPIARDELDETLSRHEAEAAEARRQRLRRFYAIAASVVAAVALGVSLFVFQPSSQAPVIAAHQAGSGKTTASVSRHAETEKGPRFSLAERIRQERRLREEAEARFERLLETWKAQRIQEPANDQSRSDSTDAETETELAGQAAPDAPAVDAIAALTPPEVTLPPLPAAPDAPLPPVSDMIEQNETPVLDTRAQSEAETAPVETPEAESPADTAADSAAETTVDPTAAQTDEAADPAAAAPPMAAVAAAE